ncbi:MAG: serine/threonine protein kinase [Myxococcales bacterium]|nr:serine/threonine protein kinase [Myxococcales bacterium]
MSSSSPPPVDAHAQTTADLASGAGPRLRLDKDAEYERMRGLVAASLFGEPAEPTRIGRFMVLEPLGAGGMGTVYAAYDDVLDRKVAVKVLRGSADEHARERMLREARAMARLSHPNIVAVHEVGEHEGQVFLAMEFVRGQSLDRWIHGAEAPLPWREVLAVFRRAGLGLAAAHAAGLVHRDFKPHNVVLGDDGTVKVLDFGLAHLVGRGDEGPTAATGGGTRSGEAEALTRTGAIVGTPAYMAPEQLRAEPATAASDQFAFCVSLFEALHGQRPFAGQRLEQLVAAKRRGLGAVPRGGAPAAFEPVLRRGLCPDPEDRWPSMDALLTALRGVSRRRQRSRGALVLALGGAVIGALAWPRTQAACDALEPLRLPDTAAPHLLERAAAWNERAQAACEAEHAPALAERMRGCLDEVRAELRAVAEVAHPVALRSPSACDDARALQAWTQPPPADPRPVLELRAELVRARAAGASAHELARLVDRARATGDRRVLAEAQLAQAHALPPGSPGGSKAGLEAAATGMEAGDVELEARGWLVALEHLAADPQRREEVLGWREVAQAQVERAGGDAWLVVRLALALDEPLRAADRADQARDLLERARHHSGFDTLDPALRERLDAALATIAP